MTDTRINLPRDGVCPKCASKGSIILERDLTEVSTPRFSPSQGWGRVVTDSIEQGVRRCFCDNCGQKFNVPWEIS
jgi:hypothetical protein